MSVYQWGGYTQVINGGNGGEALVSDYDSLEAAVVDLSGSGRTLIVNEDVVLTSDLTISEDMNLVVLNEGSIDGLYTLTINGCFDAGMYQVFGSDLSVEGTMKVPYVIPEWWGSGLGEDDTNSFIKAATACSETGPSTILLGSKIYNIKTPSIVPLDNVKLLKGVSSSSSIIQGDFSYNDIGNDTTTLKSQSFLIHSSNGIVIEDIQFYKFGAPILLEGATSGTIFEHIIMRRCKVTESYCGIQGAYLTENNWTLEIHRYEVDSCTFDKLQRGVFLDGVVVSAFVSKNQISNVVCTYDIGLPEGQAAIGLWVGNGSPSNSMDWESQYGYHITDNHIDTIESTGGVNEDSIGMILHGLDMIISGNHIRNISNTSFFDCEGIYVKGQRVIIKGNTLFNAGYRQGFINIKGLPGDDTSTYERGNNVIVSDNIIENTRDGNKVTGIHIESDEVTITGNRIYGINYIGIDVDTVNDGDARRLIHIKNNVIAKFRQPDSSYNGIYVEKTAGQTQIDGNIVKVENGTIFGDYQFYGIHLRNYSSVVVPIIEDLSINNNTIFIGDRFPANPTDPIIGIQFNRDEEAQNVKICGNIIRNSSGADDVRAIFLNSPGEDVEFLDISNNHIIGFSSMPGGGLFIDNVSGLRQFIFKDNIGVVTSNRGVATIPDGSSYVDVTHGIQSFIGMFPGKEFPQASEIKLTPYRNDASTPRVFIRLISSSLIRIGVNPVPSGYDLDVGWSIERSDFF